MSAPRRKPHCLSEWARLIACGTTLTLWPFGINSCVYDSDFGIPAGVYSFVLCALVYPLVYPVESFRDYSFETVLKLPRNFLVWGALLLAFSTPCFFSLPTFLIGFGLAASGIMYMAAALTGEVYKAPPRPAAG